jgi:hypothetical protein
MRTRKVESWVVYRFTVTEKHGPVRAVCEQAEWDALTAGRPGVYTLVQSGIRDEGVAERLARGTSGDPAPRRTSKELPPRQPHAPLNP